MANRIYNVFTREINIKYSVPNKNLLEEVTLTLKDVNRASSSLTEYYIETLNGSLFVYVWHSIDVVSKYPPAEIHNTPFTYVYSKNNIVGLSYYCKKSVPLKLVIDNTWRLYKNISEYWYTNIKQNVNTFYNSVNTLYVQDKNTVLEKSLSIEDLQYNFSTGEIIVDYFYRLNLGLFSLDLPKYISTETKDILVDFLDNTNTEIRNSNTNDIVNIEDLSVESAGSFDIILKYDKSKTYVLKPSKEEFKYDKPKTLIQKKNVQNQISGFSYKSLYSFPVEDFPKKYITVELESHSLYTLQYINTEDISRATHIVQLPVLTNTPYNYGVFKTTLATLENTSLVLRDYSFFDIKNPEIKIIPVPINTIIGDGCYCYTTGENIVIGSYGLNINSQYIIHLPYLEIYSICQSRQAKDDQVIDFSNDITYSIVCKDNSQNLLTVLISVYNNVVYTNIITSTSDKNNYIAPIGCEYLMDKLTQPDITKYTKELKTKSLKAIRKKYTVDTVKYQTNLKVLSHSGKLIKLSPDLKNSLTIPHYTFYGYLAQFYFFDKPYTFFKDTFREFEILPFTFNK